MISTCRTESCKEKDLKILQGSDGQTNVFTQTELEVIYAEEPAPLSHRQEMK